MKCPKVSKETIKLITHLQNLRDQSTHKQYVPTLKTLVGDEIQRRRI